MAAAEGVVAGLGAGKNVHVVGQARAPGDRDEEGKGGERCRGGDTYTSDQEGERYGAGLIFPASMRGRTATLIVIVAAAVAVGAILALGGGKDSSHAEAATGAPRGVPTVTVISPRNGARQTSRAV